MPLTRIVFPATAIAVREALARVFSEPEGAIIPCAVRDTAQIVLAEALNNIVEHAYSRFPGEIELSLAPTTDGIEFRILDDGLPMPAGELPMGQCPAAENMDDLPEGGFGWFLIRALAQNLEYARDEGRNRLSFRINGATIGA